MKRNKKNKSRLSDEISATMTIEDARKWVASNAYAGGAICPCCKANVEVYRRRISFAMSNFLIHLVRETELVHAQWYHLPTLVRRYNLGESALCESAKLRFWGLVEASTDIRPDGSPRNGYYRITPKGSQFAKNEIELPKYAIEYRSNVLGFEGELLSIDKCIGGFDYAEIVTSMLQKNTLFD